jgi:hypothetical protein
MPIAPRRLVAAVTAAVVVLTAAACSSSPEATATTPSSTPSSTTAGTTTATPTPTPEPEPEPVLWPLTGVEAPEAVQRPALAVKIENSVDARPQTGLGAADMVWEEVVEGGITRFVAVYHSMLPPEIGPVRSVRPMDPGIAAPLRGLMAFSGGQETFVAAVGASGLQNVSMEGGSPGYYRTGRPAPHNLYADPNALVALADSAHAASPPAQFVIAGAGEQPTAVAAGTPASVLDLALSPIGRPSWTWSPADSRWVRAERGVPAVEADGVPLRAVNVVVLRVDVVLTPFTDAIGTHVPETVMVSSGEALVATGGRTVAATWSKASIDAPVQLTGADGQPIRLAPGNTWIELVPKGSGAVAVG